MTEKQRPGLEEAEEHLSRRALEAGDPVGWFEQLYALGADGVVDLPWDRRQPHPALLGWAERRRPAGTGKTAVVPGCALGADAEFVASLGYSTFAVSDRLRPRGGPLAG